MIAVYIILGLIVGSLLLAAIMPGKYEIEKEIIIKKPPSEVFDKIADFNNYRAWNPWQKSERTAKYQISGTYSYSTSSTVCSVAKKRLRILGIKIH